MKKTVIALAAAAMTAPLAANAETSWFGFSQITAGTDATESGDNEGLRFGGDRVRIGYKASEGDAFAKLQVDFNRTEDKHNKEFQLPGYIKDAVVGYKFGGGNKISLGQFKTPVGMDFNTSGKALDITKRGMEKSLVLERSAGAMLSGDFESGFGYDVGVFNPATRTGVVNTEAGNDSDGNAGGAGEDMAYAGRIRYDMDNLHLQASYGTSQNAGGMSSEDADQYYDPNTGQMENIPDSGSDGNQDTEDYTVMDFGAKYTSGPLTAKFEYIAGQDVQGIDGWDENVWFVHGGWMLNDSVELVARHYNATVDSSDYDEHKGDDSYDADLSNTFLGANFFLNDAMRIQANYVVTGGDDGWDDNGANFAGQSAGYRDDVILTQFQYKF